MKRFAAAPLTLIVLGIVACGGGDGDAPSKADFAADATEVCKDAEKNLQGLEKATSPDEAAAQIDKVVAQMKTSMDELKGLDQPDGNAGEAAKKAVDAISSDIEDKGIPALEDLGDAIKDEDQQAAQQAFQRLQDVDTANTNELARAAGIKGCAD